MGSAGWENFKGHLTQVWGSELRHSDHKEQRRSLEFPQQMEHACKATIAGVMGRDPVRCSRFSSHWIREKFRAQGSGFLVSLAESSVA